MDAFYASVEIRDNPELAGKPVVVGGSPNGRGVISAASYEARKFGIFSAMPASQAIRLCPQAIFIRPRMNHYATVSKQIRAVFDDFTSLVEPLSLDEAFLDVGGSTSLFGDPISIAEKIKTRISDELGLTASAGVAPNKYLAKLASDLEKPDGLVVVDENRIQEFLDPLEVSRVWGVGKQTQKKLSRIGVRTIGQLRNLPMNILQPQFGLNAEHFWRLARGLDTRPVVCDRDAKSISHESTFSHDIHDLEILNAWALELSDQVTRRMRRYAITSRTVQLKIRYSNFETITRQGSLPEPTDSTRKIGRLASELLQKVEGLSRGIRLLGVGVSKLTQQATVQRMLFEEDAETKSNRIDQTTDAIRDRFGASALKRGTSLAHGARHAPQPRPEKRTHSDLD